MSTPKRAAKTTSKKTPAAAAKTASARKPATKKNVAGKAAEKSVKKPAPKKTPPQKTQKTQKAAVKKAAAKATKKTAGSGTNATKKIVRKTVKKAAAKKTVAKKNVKKTVRKAVKTAAQKVAKKVATIISKIVAKKKTAKTAAKAAPRKTTKPQSAKASRKKAAPKAAAKEGAKKAVVNAAAKTPVPKPPRAAGAQRPKSFAARPAEYGFGFPPDAPELPASYGEDRLVLMTKDPEYLFAYWEVTPARRQEGEKVMRRGEEYREALRLNWTARDIFERNFAVVSVALEARKWYIRVPFSGLSYQVEIGWLGESGHFISLLASNPSDAPESWNATRRRLKAAAAKGGILERTLELGRPQGSSEQVPAAAQAAPTGDWSFTGPGSQTSSGFTKINGGRPGA